MRRQFQDVFNTDSFVGYMDTVTPELVEATELEKFFPTEKVEGLDYSYIKTANSAVELTAPSAFDAEPIAQHREGFDAMKGELPLFRRKMVLSEKEKSLLKMYAELGNEQGVERLLSQIYNDQKTLVSGALMTQEFLRARALMDGKISIVSKGGAVAVDYKVPAENKKTLTGDKTWDKPDAKIVDDIRAWCDAVEDATGVRPTRMICNRKTFSYFTINNQIKANLMPMSLMANATLTGNIVISDAQYKATLQALTGLTEIMVYNRKVQMDGALYNLVEDNKVAIVPEGKLGNTMVGSSPAELNMADANADGANIVVMGNGIAVNTYTNTKAPYTSGTELEFVGLPSFLASDRVILATVV